MEKRTGGRENEVAPGRQVLEPPIEVGKIGAPDVAAVDDAEREEAMRRQPGECRLELAGRAHQVEMDAMPGPVGDEIELVAHPPDLGGGQPARAAGRTSRPAAN